MCNVALLGFGTVGSSVAKILCERANTHLRLTHIVNRNVARKKVDWLPPSVQWTETIDDGAEVELQGPGRAQRDECPTPISYPSQPITVQPQITSIDPNPIMIGSTNQSLTINGSGFGSSPTVSLPSGFTSSGQGSTDTQIIVTGVSVAYTATVGNNNVTVTAGGQTSPAATLGVDGPYHMIVVSDVTKVCSGCTTTVERDVTYQIQNFSTSSANATWIGETPVNTGWSCTQSQPTLDYTPCSDNFSTGAAGSFTDAWSLNRDGYTPVGCGDNTVDTWQWCKHSPAQTLGVLTGYVHTNAIEINGVVSPNQMPPGTVVPF